MRRPSLVQEKNGRVLRCSEHDACHDGDRMIIKREVQTACLVPMAKCWWFWAMLTTPWIAFTVYLVSGS